MVVLEVEVLLTQQQEVMVDLAEAAVGVALLEVQEQQAQFRDLMAEVLMVMEAALKQAEAAEVQVRLV